MSVTSQRKFWSGAARNKRCIPLTHHATIISQSHVVTQYSVTKILSTGNDKQSGEPLRQSKAQNTPKSPSVLRFFRSPVAPSTCQQQVNNASPERIKVILRLKPPQPEEKNPTFKVLPDGFSVLATAPFPLNQQRAH
jgi:hypothetical protein